MKEDFSDSSLFKKLSSECEEIQKLKWIESEKERRDIGYSRALLIWVKNHHAKWWDEYMD
jgi:hypothetical protein